MSIEPLKTPRRGLPAWVLSAILPLMLSLGFVAGMGLAHVQILAKTPTNETAAEQPESPPATGGTSTDFPNPPMNAGTVSPARVQPDTSAGAPSSEVIPPVKVGDQGPPPSTGGPATGEQTPGNVYGTPSGTTLAVHSLKEARLALMHDQAGTSLVPQIDYQEMRNSDGTVSLVGILNTEQYMTWESLLLRNPDGLQKWLQASANLVLGPTQTDPFALSWALVETRVSVPSWALPSEVTPLQDGRFLVVRDLAGTPPNSPQVVLRPHSSLGAPADPTATWSRYGPQIRFDSTDIYRPSGVTGTEPKKP